MSTTPTPPDPVPAPGPAPGPPSVPPSEAAAAPDETAAAPVEPPPPTEGPPAARSGVPRWLLITIIVVVLVAAGVIAALALTGGGDDDPPPTESESPSAESELPAADVRTISGGPVTFASHAQWDLDNNGFIRGGGNCVFANPARTFEDGVAVSVFCLAIFVPDTEVLEGRDIIVTPGGAETPALLTIAEGATVLDDRPGCPVVETEVELPPPGTPPGPPVACVQSTDGAAFAVYVTAATTGGPTIAVVKLP